MSGPSQATRLVDLAAEVGLFHTADGRAFATFAVGEHRERALVKSKAFRGHLRRLFYSQSGTAPNGPAVQDALAVLEAKALYEGDQHEVHVRLAEHEGVIYLDLCNEDWELVEITASRWRIITDAPVRFRRARGMLPLPRPERDGSIDTLYDFINVDDEKHRRLLLAWLLAAARPRGPYCVLVLHGEQGSGKSTAAQVLRELIDPNSVPLRAQPRDERDVMIAATNGWVVALNNVSHLPPWLSDALCRLASGGGFSTRELYSDEDEVLFAATRPILLNGIEEIVTRGDLLDRSLLVELPVIPDEKRRAEAEFWKRFGVARPYVLGALLDGVVTALRDLHSVHLPRRPRMADFALWATAAAPAFGWSADAFMDAYSDNRGAAHELTLDASPVSTPLRALAADRVFEGTATELLKELRDRVDDAVPRQDGWPKSARGLAGILRRLAPSLRAVGVFLSFERKAGGKRSRFVRLSTVPTVPTVPNPAEDAQVRDGGPNGRDAAWDAKDRPKGAETADRTGLGTHGDGRDDQFFWFLG
jgi:energy-coupling factor transporter ATP-binding protein EcfA2